MTLPGETGNKFSSCVGRSSEVDKPTSPPPEKSKKKLVRIGSKYFSKDTRTERRFNIGVEVGKAPSGVRFKTLNELVVDKQHTYKPVNPTLPTYPGEEKILESVPLSPISEGKESFSNGLT